jgi:hypothetical protein
MAEPSRRFPSPWRADKVPGGYVVRDANGQALVYLYSTAGAAGDSGTFGPFQCSADEGRKWPFEP